MFDVGFTEVFLIGVVSLVVIGPERLPAVAKTAGQWIAKLQRFVRGVKTDLASELETGDLKKLIGDQREQIDELRQMVSTTTKEIQSTAQSVVKGTREGLAELETSVNEAKADIAESGETTADEADIANTSTHKSTGSDTAASDANAGDQSTSGDTDSVRPTGTTGADGQ
ncbi:MAG: Sec-independent protein translocase protein TatB [Granulosicoccus sp.]